jgi:hypothetical protein
MVSSWLLDRIGMAALAKLTLVPCFPGLVLVLAATGGFHGAPAMAVPIAGALFDILLVGCVLLRFSLIPMK